MVSYGNPGDVERCLWSLARSNWIDFEVFVCENAGLGAFACLRTLLTGQDGPLEEIGDSAELLDSAGGRLTVVAPCRFRRHPIAVHLAAAAENLGYAGGVNAWLERLLSYAGWEAALVLNPDTTLAETCLSELMAKAAEGFGMVGATLVYDDAPDTIVNYGLHWSRRTGRRIAVGMNYPASSVPSAEDLARIDAISGACMLVTRRFIDDVGLMAEEYFLYLEDLDWGMRRRHQKMALASRAFVRHVGGASIGNFWHSPLSAYLTCRNGILFSRRWAGSRWRLHFAVGFLYVVKVLLYGYLELARFALTGLIDGARGQTGRPNRLFDGVRPREK